MNVLILAFTGLFTPATPSPPFVIGDWSGHYNCAQGATALDLEITQQDPSHIQALFYFHALPANPAVPTGCFLMTGTFDGATGELSLQPTSWLLRPEGYVSVSITGQLTTPTTLAGAITGPGCTEVSLTRAEATATRPTPCKTQPSIS